jgi:hypothetical protein
MACDLPGIHSIDVFGHIGIEMDYNDAELPFADLTRSSSVARLVCGESWSQVLRCLHDWIMVLEMRTSYSIALSRAELLFCSLSFSHRTFYFNHSHHNPHILTSRASGY